MSSQNCPKCNEFIYSFNAEKHHCQLFKITTEDDDYEQYASNEEDALDKFMEKYNANNECALIDNSMDVFINGSTYRLHSEVSVSNHIEKL